MKLTLVKKVTEASGTVTFFWKSERKIEYLPGQYFYYTLPKLNYPDTRGATRHFTISSSGTEGEELMLTTRIRAESGYKKSLDELKIGESLEGDGPNGTFILNEEKSEPQIFLAGGIGITPFRSFIKFAIDSGLKTPLYLIYSNSHTEEIVFKNELEKWAQENENFKLILTVSKPEESKEKWSGKVGRIDEKLILESVKNWQIDIKNSTFWVCGPPPMVSAMEETLEKLNVSPANIVTEKFTGY